MFVREPDAFTVAAGQNFCVARCAAAFSVNRAHRVNHIFCGQMSRAGDHRFACGQSSDTSRDSFAFLKDRRAASAVNCAIDSAAPHES